MSNTTSPIRSEMVTVTPAMAIRWLENANIRNRKLSQNHINKLARDIKNGQWKLTHAGIAFDPNGVLLDGQHRLWAIVESETPIDLMVFYNVPNEALMAIDCGKSRNVVDVLKLSNKDGYITSSHTSTLRALLGGYGAAPTLTQRETSEQLANFRSAIDFAVKHLSSCRFRGICNAATRAVIARAWYSADPEKLIHFCDILTSGIVGHTPAATVLVSLQQYLLTTRDSSSAARRERYGKTERALKAFLNAEALSKLVTSNSELFPLPQDARKSA
jgi:hypothetical protein